MASQVNVNVSPLFSYMCYFPLRKHLKANPSLGKKKNKRIHVIIKNKTMN